MVAIKRQVDCLLSTLHQVGPGNGQLAKKGVLAINEDQKMAKESGLEEKIRREVQPEKGIFHDCMNHEKDCDEIYWHPCHR